MATTISFLDNFPVKFNNVDDSCLECDTRSFCQLAQWSDKMEFAYHPSTTDIAVTNGTFTGSLTGWTAGSGWTYNAGKARITNDTGELYQFIPHFIGKKYKISFEVSNYSGTGSMTVYFGATASVGTVSANGSYSFYITPSNADELGFLPGAATFILDLDNVTLELLNDACGIKLYNTATHAYSASYLTANISNAATDLLGFSYTWSQLALSIETDGCYQIKFFDGLGTGLQLITNGTFPSNLNGWTVTGSAGWVWDASGKASLSIVSAGSKRIAQSLNYLIIGRTYTLTFDITGYSGPSNLFVLFLTDGSGNSNSLTISADGSYSMTFTYTGITGSGTANLVAFSTAGTSTINVMVDNVSIVDTITCTEVATSECYKIKADQGCTTKMLTWTNGAVNGFNYPYYYFYNGSTTGFQYMRVESDIRNSKYKGEEDKYIDSGGNNKIYYSSSRKQKEFIVGMMPEYMHDALSIGLIHKEFYIDGVRYTFEDTDYLPEWSSDVPTILAQVKILIGKFMENLNQID